MNTIKGELREVIIHMTAEQMAPFLVRRISASQRELIETFKRLVQFGEVKIGIMPFESEGQDQFHSVSFIKANKNEEDHIWVSLETGNPVELHPGLEKVFTLTEEQYQKVYGNDIKS